MMNGNGNGKGSYELTSTEESEAENPYNPVRAKGILRVCTAKKNGRYYLMDKGIGDDDIEVLDLDVGKRLGAQYFLPAVKVKFSRPVMERICKPQIAQQVMNAMGWRMGAYDKAYETAEKETARLSTAQLEKRLMEDYGMEDLMPDGVGIARVSWVPRDKNKRYEREVRTVGINGNVVRNFMTGITFGDRPYFVGQYIRNNSDGDLEAKIGKKAYGKLMERVNPLELGFEDLCGVFKDVLEFLDYARRRGLIHRDIKPDNIMVVKDGDSYKGLVGDLGLAKMEKMSNELSLTEKDMFVGSLKWAAPEQASGRKIDAVDDWSADLYSLAKTMYYWLSGGKDVVPLPDDMTPEEKYAFTWTKVMRADERPKILNAVEDGKGTWLQRLRMSQVLSGMWQMNISERYEELEDVGKDIDSVLRGKRPQNIRKLTREHRMKPEFYLVRTFDVSDADVSEGSWLKTGLATLGGLGAAAGGGVAAYQYVPEFREFVDGLLVQAGGLINSLGI